MILQKAILELLCELLNIPQPEWTDDENIALESIQFSQHRESFKLSEGFLVSEGKMVLPNFSKTRLALSFNTVFFRCGFIGILVFHFYFSCPYQNILRVIGFQEIN